MAALICLIHRVILNVDTPYVFPIPAEITNACINFIDNLSLLPQDEEIAIEHEEEFEESSDSSDDEDVPLPPPGGLNRPTHTPISSTKNRVEALLYSLFIQLPTGELRGQFFTPIYHFLVLSSLRKNGEWAAANKITHTIAAILFTGRIVFALKTIEIAQENNADYARSVNGI
jgi:hypothetical protein